MLHVPEPLYFTRFRLEDAGTVERFIQARDVSCILTVELVTRTHVCDSTLQASARSQLSIYIILPESHPASKEPRIEKFSR